MHTLAGLISATRRHPTEGQYIGDQVTGLIVTRAPTSSIGGSLGQAQVVGGRQIADAPPFIAGDLIVSSIEFEVPAPKANNT